MSEDDKTIGDDVHLWRRIHPAWHIFDRNKGQRRLTSQAFQNYSGTNAFSVGISCDAESEGATPVDFLGNHEGYGVAAFTAGLARRLDQAVKRVPKPREIAHGHVIGTKTRRVRSQLAKNSKLLIEPG